MMTTKSTTRHLMAAAVCASMAAAAITAYSPSAEACGGLFCNNAQPVNQSAERIIFSDNPDDTVTAVVQIMYQGPSEKFAWLLPVPGNPEVDVSSTQALDRLQSATNPSYRMNTTVQGDCDSPGGLGGLAESADASGGRNANNGSIQDPNDSEVTVINNGSVGQYEFTTISVATDSTDPAQAAIDWLEDNQYDVTGFGKETMRPYLEDGMNLLALKLTKDATSDDIRPVKLTYDAELPMIPIKLTAVAANDDMGVMVWVLSDDRAIPSNYKSLRLNEAAIDWFNPNNNYNQVINRAADEAGGQGFVTELAWPTAQQLPPPNQFSQGADLSAAVFTQNEQRYWRDEIKAQDWSNNKWGLLQRTARYGSFDGYMYVFEKFAPFSDSVSATDFMQCPDCYRDQLDSEALAGFDAQLFVDKLDEFVLSPMIETQELINSRPYITRMYTTMSAADMTLDPVFDFNAGLGDHSNAHVAERVIECGDEAYTRSEAPWHVDLPQGDVVYGKGSSWPSFGSDMPANRVIVQDHNSGDGDIVTDNTGTIDAKITEHNQRITDQYSGGCQVTNPASVTLARNVALGLMFGAFGLLLIRVRRRE